MVIIVLSSNLTTAEHLSSATMFQWTTFSLLRLSQLAGKCIHRTCPCLVLRTRALGCVNTRVPHRSCSTSQPYLGTTKPTIKPTTGTWDTDTYNTTRPTKQPWGDDSYGFDALVPTRPSPGEIELNKRILQIKSVAGQLKVFENHKDSPNMNQFNRATVLCRIARAVQYDEKQLQVLDYKRLNPSPHSALLFKDLLDCILEGMEYSRSFNLARIVWALGKVHEDHPLFDVCETEILNKGIRTFNNNSICQIATGVSSRVKPGSMILREIEKGILSGEIQISDFSNADFAGVLHSFARASQGSVALFEHILEVCLLKDFSKLSYQELATFAWSFAKKDLTSEKLAQLVEKEIHKRGTSDLSGAELVMILWAFGTKHKSKRLFGRFDKELSRRGVGSFATAGLIQIVWSFGKRRIKRAKVFNLVEEEMGHRGLTELKGHELSLLLWSFVEADNPSREFYKKIKQEFLSRDVSGFTDSELCQLACSFGKSGAWSAEVFDSIQKEMVARDSRALPVFSLIVLIRGFVEAKRAGKKFADQLEPILLDSDFAGMGADKMVELLALLARMRLRSPLLYNSIEREIFNHSKSDFEKSQVESIEASFSRANAGSQELFALLRSITND